MKHTEGVWLFLWCCKWFSEGGPKTFYTSTEAHWIWWIHKNMTRFIFCNFFCWRTTIDISSFLRNISTYSCPTLTNSNSRSSAMAPSLPTVLWLMRICRKDPDVIITKAFVHNYGSWSYKYDVFSQNYEISVIMRTSRV